MGTEVERTDSAVNRLPEDELKQLEASLLDLREESQNLITERNALETEIRGLRKKVDRLEENVNIMKMPPLIIGHLQDVLDHERAIVRSSNGTVFQVSLNQRLDPDKLKPGTRRTQSRQPLGD